MLVLGKNGSVYCKIVVQYPQLLLENEGMLEGLLCKFTRLRAHEH